MPQVSKVQLSLEDTDKVFEYVSCYCNFCNKQTKLSTETYKHSVNLGHGHFYCSFCLRNRFNYKKRNQILLMDFRGIIGFYFNYLYKDREIWYTQILDYVKKHAIIGTQNPVFFYDPETFIWFIDFERVGKSIHKTPIESVIKTTHAIIDCFDLSPRIANVNVTPLKEKYNQAIKDFYEKRERPEGHRVLSPSLKNCTYRANVDWEESKQFVVDSEALQVIPSGNIRSVENYDELLEIPIEENIEVKMRKRKLKGKEGWEGSVEIPGLTKSKVSSKNGETLFDERAKVSAIARRMAKRLGMKPLFNDSKKKDPSAKEQKVS